MLQATNIAANWLYKYFRFKEIEKENVLLEINSKGSNSNGFGIIVETPVKIIAEVKTSCSNK